MSLRDVVLLVIGLSVGAAGLLCYIGWMHSEMGRAIDQDNDNPLKRL